jgi:hypothetical protein
MKRKVRAARESWFPGFQVFGAGFFFFGFLAMTEFPCCSIE